MRQPPEKNVAGVGAPAEKKLVLQTIDEKFNKGISEKLQGASLNPVAIIQKSHCSRLRIGISEWRGTNSVEIRECSAVIADIYFPTGNGISLPIKKLPELLEAIIAAEREAIERGLLSSRRAA